VLLKDIAEEAVLMDPDLELPPDVERNRAEVPDELKALSVLTDVVDVSFRFLNAILVAEGTIGEGDLWKEVAACIADYQAANPEYAERFERHDLFANRFAPCLNRDRVLQRDAGLAPGDPREPALRLQDVHPGVGAVHDVHEAAVVDFDVVGLDRCLAASWPSTSMHRSSVFLVIFGM
jgi:siderophore synthetase component